MPMFFPSGPITRTSRARIFPLTLTNEPEEEKLREGKGRLKQPSSVETYSCRFVTDILRNLCRLIKHLSANVQANNHLLRSCNMGCSPEPTLNSHQYTALSTYDRPPTIFRHAASY